MRLICGHRIVRDLHVVEHAFQFLCELESALNLELSKHASLSIVRYRSSH